MCQSLSTSFVFLLAFSSALFLLLPYKLTGLLPPGLLRWLRCLSVSLPSSYFSLFSVSLEKGYLSGERCRFSRNGLTELLLKLVFPMLLFLCELLLSFRSISHFLGSFGFDSTFTFERLHMWACLV